MSEYHNPGECPVCGNDHHEKVLDTVANNACEIETTCFACGYTDLWAYGYFQGICMGWVVEYRVMWKMRNGASLI